MKVFTTFDNALYDQEVIKRLEDMFDKKIELSPLGESDVQLLIRKGRFSGTDNPLVDYIPTKPAVLIVGTIGEDAEGEKMAEEADNLGVQEILVCPDGNSSVSFDVVVKAIKNAIEKKPITEQKPVSAWEKNGRRETRKTERTVKQTVPEQETQGKDLLLETILDSYKHHVIVVGAKGGVGCSTVCASLNAVFAEFESYHLEVGNNGSYLYYGSNSSEASKKEYYGYVTNSDAKSALKKGMVLLVDLKLDEILTKRIFERSKKPVVIMVADTSMLSFENVKTWYEKKWPMDIFVLNRVIYGIGVPPEVYNGELGIDTVSIPGGSDEERVLNIAQREHKLPLAISEEYDAAIGEVAAKIREILKF